MFTIDWGNLPKCGEDGLVISPYICVDDSYTPPPIDNPPVAVPVPSTIALMLIGVTALGMFRKKKK